MEKYLVTVFSILGAFLVFGFTGSIVGHEVGLNQTSTSGFFAAFGVVLMTYWGVPKFKIQFSVGIFVLGAVLSWLLLGDEYIMILGGEPPRVSNLWPFASTCIGGLFCLFVLLFPFKKLMFA